MPRIGTPPTPAAFTSTVAERRGVLAAETALTTKTLRWYNRRGRPVTVTALYASVDTAPATTAITVAVRKNAAGANDATVTIAAAGLTGSATGLAIVLADGDYLQAWTTTVGTTTTGSDLTVVAVAS